MNLHLSHLCNLVWGWIKAFDSFLQARRLEAQFSTHSLRRAGPLPRSVARRRDRASLHARLLGSYLAALDQPPPPGTALSVRWQL